MNATQNTQATEMNVTDVVDNTGDTAPVEVIFRRDASGSRCGFLKNTLDLSVEGGRIAVWLEGHKRDLSVVPLSYYYSTTKLDHPDFVEIQNRFCESYKPKFGISLKSRLGKNLEHNPTHPSQKGKTAVDTLRRSTDMKATDWNKEETMQKLQIALTAAISAAFAAVAKGEI